ncbi:MAG: hypothetical protein VB878_13755, partial [Pirellulaceae bacterium]
MWHWLCQCFVKVLSHDREIKNPRLAPSAQIRIVPSSLQYKHEAQASESFAALEAHSLALR